MIDLRQTKEYVDYMNSIGWNVERVKNVNYFIKKIGPIGSVLKIQRPEKIDFALIEKLAKKYRAFQIIIEPGSEVDRESLKVHRFKQSTPYLPSKTIHIDVTKSNDAILKAMHYKTRYNIKVAQKNNVDVETSEDIETFAKLWQIEAKSRGFFVSQEKEIQALYRSFGRNGQIIFAFNSTTNSHHNYQFPITNFQSNQKLIGDRKLDTGNILGGILLIFTNDICYYMYAFSTKEGKKLFAPTLLVWKTLQLAKKRKVMLFDFEGIFDERFPLPAWKGFTRFKKSFGGKEIEYPGAFTKWRLPL